jgi:diaminopimelate decarboxylase
LHHFDVIDGALSAEGVSLSAIAAEVGTPVYVYSTATLTRHYSQLREALDAHAAALGDGLIAFAVKANSNLSVLATLARLGCGADTVSEGEIRRALAAGVPADRMARSVFLAGGASRSAMRPQAAAETAIRAQAPATTSFFIDASSTRRCARGPVPAPCPRSSGGWRRKPQG